MVEIDTKEATEPLKELSEHMKDAPIAPTHGIASIALSLALKYHDIATVQDGALYQQYKLEGKNMRELHLDMVFETAIKMEMYLLGASERIAKVIVEAIEWKLDGEDELSNAPDESPSTEGA